MDAGEGGGRGGGATERAAKEEGRDFPLSERSARSPVPFVATFAAISRQYFFFIPHVLLSSSCVMRTLPSEVLVPSRVSATACIATSTALGRTAASAECH